VTSDRLPSPDLPRNPETYAAHRRDVLWQIWLPIGATIGIIVLFVLLILLIDRGTLSQWGGLATILLVVPLLILGFIVLAVLLGGIVLLTQFLPKVSPFMLQAQIFVIRLEIKVRKLADALVEPAIRTRQNWARLSVLRRDRS
jgi:uncharacterized membrane protein YadS